MKLILTYSLLLFTFLTNAHPVHFSITNIDFEEKEIKIQLKLFTDDIFNNLKLDINQIQNDEYLQNANVQKTIKSYIEKNCALHINNKQHKLNLKNIILQKEQLLINVSINFNKKVKEIFITNNILADCFHDQNNLIIVKYKEDLKAIKLNSKNNWSSKLIF